MALRTLLASASLCLLFAALPTSAASGDPVATGTYAVSTHVADEGDLGTVWVVAACVALYADGSTPTLLGIGSCNFQLPAGSYAVAVHDEVLGDVPFTYQVTTFGGDECAFVQNVDSATITVSGDCDQLTVVPDPTVATAGVVSITEA